LIYYEKNDIDNAIKDFTKAMKLNASFTFQNIPENMKTEEMCLIAVKANSFNLKYVPENLKTEEAKWLCLAALENLERVREEGREEVFALWESGISLEEAREELED